MSFDHLLVRYTGAFKGLIILVVTICVMWAVRPTLTIVSKSLSLSRKSKPAISRQAPIHGEILHSFDEVDINKSTFDLISKYSEPYHVTIEQTELPVSQAAKGGQILTQRITLRGEFVNMLKCLNDVGIKLSSIKIASIQFRREERSKTVLLTATVYFQSVKPMEYEKE